MASEPGGDDPESGAPDPDRRSHDPISSPDDIFANFVRRANAEWVKSVEAALQELEDETPIDHEGTERILLLTSRKSQPPPALEDVTVRKRTIEMRASEGAITRPPSGQLGARPRGVRAGTRAAAAGDARPESQKKRERASEDWPSIVPQPGELTQRREAARLVPDVANVTPPIAPPPEGIEDGQIPGGELDRKLGDMDVLVRYGHSSQVQSELETLRLTYPHDLLLLRRIAELYVKHALRGPAREALFALATGLFERRNIEGMRQALEQVLVLEPQNRRAQRLLALLEQRPAASRDSSPPRSPPRGSTPPAR